MIVKKSSSYFLDTSLSYEKYCSVCYLLKYNTVNIYTDLFHDNLREILLLESKAG